MSTGSDFFKGVGSCPPGKAWNIWAQRCVDIADQHNTKLCPHGMYYSETAGKCVQGGPPPKCPPGQKWDYERNACINVSTGGLPPPVFDNRLPTAPPRGDDVPRDCNPIPKPDWQDPGSGNSESGGPGWSYDPDTGTWWYSGGGGQKPGSTPCPPGYSRPPRPLPPRPDDPIPHDDDAGCDEAKICDGLTAILDRIAKTQEDIAKVLAEKWGDCDSLISKCGDELGGIIESKIDAELKKFADCQRKAAAGLCGTAEYEQQCAKYALTCAEDACYEVGIGNKEGACKTCGKEPCCCVDGECKPCPEEPKEDDKYYGWCDSITGLVYVTEGDEPAPTPSSQSVSFGDTEQIALRLATDYCSSRGMPPIPPIPKPPIQISPTIAGCDLLGYLDGRAAATLKQAAGKNIYDVGRAQIITSVNDAGFAGLTLNDAGQIIDAALKIMLGVPAAWAGQYIEAAASMIGCESPIVKDTLTSYGMFGLLQKQTGVDLSQLTSPYLYAISAQCRNRQLDPDKAIAAWLANAQTDQELDANWAIHGLCAPALHDYKEAARSKAMPLELAAMQMRGLIPDKEYYDGMRRLGYTDAFEAKRLLALRQQLPTMSDIIHFMVRDADDLGLVDKFKLDTGFKTKYQKTLRTWAEQQGVPEEVVRYAWRSHWTIPNPTQLFSFWRRLRKNPKFGGEPKLWADIEEALVQQDILPYWHEHFKAVSFLPLGRVDIRRMFNIGSVPEADLEGLYQQLGYSDADALRQKKFAIRDRNNSIAKHKVAKLWTDALITRQEAEQKLIAAGYPQEAVTESLDIAQYDFDVSTIATSFAAGGLTRQQFQAELDRLGVDLKAQIAIADKIGYRKKPGVELRQYAVGIIDRQMASNIMTGEGIPADVAENALFDLDNTITIDEVLACQSAIRRRFITGDLDRIDAEVALTRSGTMQSRAAKLVASWACLAVAKGKDAAIPRLCGWLAQGSIGPQDFLVRTNRLGYDPDDSAMIMNDCLISINAKRNADAKRQAKEAVAESEAQKRKTERQLAQAKQATAALDRAKKQRGATLARRQKQLLSAAEKIIKKCDCDLAKAYAFAIDANNRAQSEYALDKDESLQALLTAVDNWTSGIFDDLVDGVSLAASLLQVTEPELVDSAGLSLPSTNGHVNPS